MPQVVNFDDLTVGTVEVTKTRNGTTRIWNLRDDVPTEVLMRFFELSVIEQEKEQEQEQPTEGVAARILDNFHIIDRIYGEILTAIFRHSYPEMTEDELRAWFSFDERKRLVDLFFSQAGIVSSVPSTATPPGTPSGAMAVPATTKPHPNPPRRRTTRVTTSNH